MIKTVAVEFHWPPHIFLDMFCDSVDHLGIGWWYKFCEEQFKKQNK